jgi:PAS domain S-box-containing protein
MEGEQPGWAALTGQAYAEYQGYGWSNAVHPEDAQPTIKAWEEAVQERKNFVFEHRVRRRDGKWRRFSIRAIPVFDGQGSIREWVGVHTDITEQRAAEEALLDLTASLEKRVRVAIAERDRAWNNARDLLAMIDSTGVIRAANPAWTGTLGWAAEEIAGRNALDFIHPDDLEKTREALAAASVGVLQGYECRARHKDDSYRSISCVAAPEGDLVYLNGRDITAEKKALEALEQSEARMRAIFETSYQYKGIVALDGTLLDANPTSLRGINGTLEDVVGKPFWDTPWFTATPGMPEMVKGALADVAKGATFRQEVLVNLPIGLHWFDFTIRPIRGTHGEVAAIVPEAADITARRQAEEALRQSQKLEAIGQLTGGIAHDFNNLLTPIVGSLDLIRRRLGGSDERAERLLCGAMQSAERARLLVQRLLAFARRQHLEARAVNVPELVSGLGDLLRRSLGPGIAIELDMEPNLPAAKADPNQLELALLNLAVNARDAMPEGGTLSIGAKAVTLTMKAAGLPPGQYVRLTVTDNGTGMTPETLARAIEPFYSTKDVGKGTGLGLSMVHGLAAQSGGQLTLESSVGVGTTAALWLPAVAHGPGLVTAVEAPAYHLPSQPLSILLVDDEDLVRQGTAIMLELMGHNVVHVSSGFTALDRLAQGMACDLLLTDQMMPGITGVELTARARTLRPGLPAILITGHANLAQPAGGDIHWLAKPFHEADLARAVSAAIKSS